MSLAQLPSRAGRMQHITQKRLKEILHYDPATGIFTWRVAKGFRVHIGMQAGNPDNKGYRRIGFDGKQYKASHLAWLYVTGKWPKSQIDHKNRNKRDDRFSNLREATPKQNRRNQIAKNKTGTQNIVFAEGRYRVMFRIDGLIYCRRFQTLKKAKIARDKMARKLYGEFNPAPQSIPLRPR